jgi:hypothetical protein
VSRFRFISEHRAVYGVKRLCRVLNVSRSGFYAWLAGASGRAAQAAQEERLVTQIRRIHTDTHGTYGSPRVTVELRALGTVVNHKRVERLMREHQIIGRHLRRRHTTTRRDPAAQAAPDLLGRDFAADQPDSRWVGDITYLRVAVEFPRERVSVVSLAGSSCRCCVVPCGGRGLPHFTSSDLEIAGTSSLDGLVSEDLCVWPRRAAAIFTSRSSTLSRWRCSRDGTTNEAIASTITGIMRSTHGRSSTAAAIADDVRAWNIKIFAAIPGTSGLQDHGRQQPAVQRALIAR